MSTKQTQTNLLYEASKLLGSPSNLKNGLDAVLTGILHTYGLSSCLLLLKNGDSQLKAEHWIGVSQTFAQTVALKSGEGPVGIVFASGLPRQISSKPELDQDELLKTLASRSRLTSALIFPLRAEGRIIGVAFLGSQNAKVFSDKELKEIGDIADHLALALSNNRKVADLELANRQLQTQVASTVQELARTNTHLVQKVRELKAIYELALATAASTRVDEIVRLMTACVKELLEVQGAAFFYFRGSTEQLDPMLPAFDVDPTVAQGLTCKVGDSQWLTELLRTKQPQILNLLDSNDSLPASWAPLSIRSLLALPLLHDGSVRGFFCVINKVNGLFNPDDVRLLSLLTGRVTDMIYRISLDEELHKRVNDLSMLQEIADQLPSPPILTDTIAAIGKVARRALSADICFFFLHHPESEALVMKGGDWDHAFTFDARAFTLGVSEKVPLAQVFRDHEPARFDREARTGVWEKDEIVQALKLHQALYLPLKVEQRCVGVLVLGLSAPRTFSPEKQRLASLLATQMAIVVERSILYDRLKTANEKLEQINRMKNEFISMVSHELRTPLTTIKGFVSIVLNEETGPLNDQQRHFLETSDRAIDRLTLLVSDLLDISRIEAGQIKMQLRPTSVGDLCRKIASNFAPQLKAQNLTLSISIAEALPQVLADPDRIMQVLDNLLSNSIKFTSQGGITIKATDKGDFVMIAVRDTGSGIAKDEQDRIFDKFYQVKVGSGYPNKGTGLGLAIVKSIVESHRGKVWVESEIGKGSEFRFILPRARPEAMPERKP